MHYYDIILDVDLKLTVLLDDARETSTFTFTLVLQLIMLLQVSGISFKSGH